MYTLDDLRKDIGAVVNYNWQSEQRDYEECQEEGNDNSAEGHIFLVLQRLDEFAALQPEFVPPLKPASTGP